MSYRRRHRWLRRLALGLALVSAVFAGRAQVAVAKIHTGVPVEVQDPYLTDVFVRQGEGLGEADGVAPVTAALRPDDEGTRPVQSSAAARPTATPGGWTLEREEALIIAIGSAALALGIGLALGYIRRPRLAGM